RFMHFASWPYSRSANGIGCLTALRQGPERNLEDQLRGGLHSAVKKAGCVAGWAARQGCQVLYRESARTAKPVELNYHLHAPAGFASWAFASLPANQPLQFFGGEVTICQQGWRG